MMLMVYNLPNVDTTNDVDGGSDDDGSEDDDGDDGVFYICMRSVWYMSEIEALLHAQKPLAERKQCSKLDPADGLDHLLFIAFFLG